MSERSIRKRTATLPFWGACLATAVVTVSLLAANWLNWWDLRQGILIPRPGIVNRGFLGWPSLCFLQYGAVEVNPDGTLIFTTHYGVRGDCIAARGAAAAAAELAHFRTTFRRVNWSSSFWSGSTPRPGSDQSAIRSLPSAGSRAGTAGGARSSVKSEAEST